MSGRSWVLLSRFTNLWVVYTYTHTHTHTQTQTDSLHISEALKGILYSFRIFRYVKTIGLRVTMEAYLRSCRDVLKVRLWYSNVELKERRLRVVCLLLPFYTLKTWPELALCWSIHKHGSVRRLWWLGVINNKCFVWYTLDIDTSHMIWRAGKDPDRMRQETTTCIESTQVCYLYHLI